MHAQFQCKLSSIIKTCSVMWQEHYKVPLKILDWSKITYEEIKIMIHGKHFCHLNEYEIITCIMLMCIVTQGRKRWNYKGETQQKCL